MVNPVHDRYFTAVSRSALFSGIGYRAIVFAVLFVIGLVSALLYGSKIRKNPDKSYVADEYKAQLAEQAEAKDDCALALETVAHVVNDGIHDLTLI